MKNLLLTMSLSLTVLPIYADELSPMPAKGGYDLPPPRTTAPKPPAAPAETAPAAKPVAVPTPAPVAAPAEAAPATKPVAAAVAAPVGNWYVNINTGVTRAELESGGYNTAGPFANTGDDHDGFEFGFLGLSVGRSLGSLRLEAEFTGRNSKDFTTGPSSYNSSAQTNNVMLNLFCDHAINSRWSAFVGAGIGAAFVDLKTSDGMVKGSSSETNFAWQGMLGAAYVLDKANSLNFGYRYFDAGNTDISLNNIGGRGSAGNFEADLTYHDIFVGWKHLL